MKKTPAQVTRQIGTRIDDTWVSVVLSELGIAPPTGASAPETTAPARSSWPHTFHLGRASSAELADNIGGHIRALQDWRAWRDAHSLDLEEETRKVGGTDQVAVKNVTVNDIDKAAAIVGAPWPGHLTLARARAAHLAEQFPAARPELARVLRPVIRLEDVDFDILCRTADWFRRIPESERAGLTSRQVPIEGVHAKWLNTHQALVRTLAGLDDLDLLPPHPARIHFTYLDPAHLDAGGRRHDSYSVGDTVALPYEPAVVLISENKDTAVGFPRVAGGITVEGAGTGGGTIASIDWIRHANVVIYWGDIDADGLEILNEFRERGVPATSMLMDLDTYETYLVYGTNHDRHHKPLTPHPPRELPHLRAHEQAVYDHLTSGNAPVLRVEQERIPLERAAGEVARLHGTRAF